MPPNLDRRYVAVEARSIQTDEALCYSAVGVWYVGACPEVTVFSLGLASCMP